MKILIFSVLLFFLCATPTHAHIVISEVYPAPTSEEKEWIELFNTSDQPVDISGWKLFEYFATLKEITTFPGTTVIDPHGFFVFELDSSRLNNTEEKISLHDSQGTVVSSLQYASSETQKSISLLFLDATTIGLTLAVTTPTKAALNPLESVQNSAPPQTPVPTPSTPLPTPVAAAATAIPTPIPTPAPTQSGITSAATVQESQAMSPQAMIPTTATNKPLELYKQVASQLQFPPLERIEKEGLTTRAYQFSYLLEKKVSKQGVINAIIGGSLLLLTGFLL